MRCVNLQGTRLVDNSCSNDDKALILLLEKEKV